MLSLRFKKGDCLVIGDPASEDVILIQINGHDSRILAQADSGVPVYRLKSAMKRLEERGESPSKSLQEYLDRLHIEHTNEKETP